MRDRYGRTIEYMRVSVTDRCNLRCVYCMPEQGVRQVSHEDILTFDEICRICRIGAELGISRIKLTGGEPLVRRGIEVLVGRLKEIPGICQVTMTTNGILLKDKIKELVSSGLDAVNISMDTLDEEQYRRITRRGELKDVLEGIDAALMCPGLPVRINCVPLADGNHEEWIRMAGMARDRRLDVRFIEMMPLGLGREFKGISGDEICRILTGAYGVPSSYEGPRPGNGPAEYQVFPGFRGRVGFISAVSHQFCDRCNRIRLTPEGFLKTCLQYEAGQDLRTLLRTGASDEQIRETMERAVHEKPFAHHFGSGEDVAGEEGRAGEGQTEWREMSRIGG